MTNSNADGLDHSLTCSCSSLQRKLGRHLIGRRARSMCVSSALSGSVIRLAIRPRRSGRSDLLATPSFFSWPTRFTRKSRWAVGHPRTVLHNLTTPDHSQELPICRLALRYALGKQSYRIPRANKHVPTNVAIANITKRNSQRSRQVWISSR